MILYPGIAPLTVATSGATGGVIVTSGPTDPHGWWPVPLVAEGNDARSAANLMAAVESATDRTNWLGWRAADWIAGGDYRSLFRGNVQFGNTWYLDRSWNSGTEAVVQIYGPTGGGTASLDVFAGGGNGNAIRGSGFGSGSGIVGAGGSSGGSGGAFTGGAGGNGIACVAGSGGGDGAVCTATGNGVGVFGIGSGSGAGVYGTAGSTTGTPAIFAHSGPLRTDTHIATTSTAPHAGDLWMSNVPVAWGRVTFDGTNPPVLTDGYNIASVAFADANASLVVTLATGLSGGVLCPVVTFYEDDVNGYGRSGTFHAVSGTSFSIRYWVLIPGAPGSIGAGGYVLGVAGALTFVVFGRY